MNASPAFTGSLESVFTMERSADLFRVTGTLLVSLSGVVSSGEATVAVLVMVPPGTPVLAVTLAVIVQTAAPARFASVQLTFGVKVHTAVPSELTPPVAVKAAGIVSATVSAVAAPAVVTVRV